ncbi:MAG: 3'-5' exonuclease, partial [Terracidiphilus sp.]
WLGVLRAPWCGLALADLHILVSANDAEISRRPVPQLLHERIHLLSAEGRGSTQRVLSALESEQRERAVHPTGSTGTWLEQVWLRLGGAQCVDAAARANLDLLWSRLDSLPEGEQDVLGPALDAAIRELKAQPDPAAESDWGVQLMTIHNSKGLEFEVVIVPELQAATRRSQPEMLSWLERGLAASDDPEEVTEFLVAPFQPKGAARGDAKAFVDGARREREKQELRRLLYVAATRARNELHLLARLDVKTEKNGSLTLATAKDTLLSTAWPAYEAEIQRRFNEWSAARQQEHPEPVTIDSIAAGEEQQRTPAALRRLPADFVVAMPGALHGGEDAPLLGAGRLYERHEGGLLSRAFGQAAHVLLQRLAQLLATQSQDAALAALAAFVPRVAADIRSVGIDAQQSSRIAQDALALARNATADTVGAWILTPHADAASEVRWTGVIDGNLRTVQVDRVFRAGSATQSNPPAGDATTWWIIDYKTAHQDGLDPAAALPELRRTFAPQVEAYGKVLRNLHGTSVPVKAGLYYPRMAIFDWWEI